MYRRFFHNSATLGMNRDITMIQDVTGSIEGRLTIDQNQCPPLPADSPESPAKPRTNRRPKATVALVWLKAVLKNVAIPRCKA